MQLEGDWLCMQRWRTARSTYEVWKVAGVGIWALAIKEGPLPALPRKRGRRVLPACMAMLPMAAGQKKFVDLRSSAFRIDGTENREVKTSDDELDSPTDTPSSGTSPWSCMTTMV